MHDNDMRLTSVSSGVHEVFDEYFYPIKHPDRGKQSPMIVTYRDGDVYRRYDDSVQWTVETDAFFDLEIERNTCNIRSKQLGKTQVTAIAENGTVDTTTVNVIPAILDLNPASLYGMWGLTFNEEEWVEKDFMLLPLKKQPIFGDAVDIQVTQNYEGLVFPHGYTCLDFHTTMILHWMGNVDPDIEVGLETEYDKHGGWFVTYDSLGRKIVLYCWMTSYNVRIAWHVLQEAPELPED